MPVGFLSAIGQKRAYRRGVVLGLTIAEVVLLMLFAILMTLTAVLSNADPDQSNRIAKALTFLEAAEGAGLQVNDDWARISDALALLAVAEAAGLEITDDWERISDALALQTAAEGAGLQVNDDLARISDALALLAVAEAAGFETAENWDRLFKEGAILNALAENDISLEPLARDVELARAAVETVEAGRGELLISLAAAPDFFAWMHGLLTEGYTSSDVAAAISAAAQIREHLSLARISELPPDIMSVLAGDIEGGNQWPPIITLSEAEEKFHFATGSSVLSDDFKKILHGEIAPQILALMQEFEVNIVEVIGHTDEREVTRATSNLDGLVVGVLRGNDDVAELRPGDNAGLGFARAIAVATELMSDPLLVGRTIIPLSAGQVVDVTGRLTDGNAPGADVAERRRIEIRVRQ